MHLPQGCTAHTPWLSAAEEDQSGARRLARHSGSHVSGRRQVSKRPDPHVPHDQRSTRRCVLVVATNDTQRVSATDSEEARRIQANANRAQRRAEEQRQAVPPCARDLRLEFEEAGLPTFNNPMANLDAALAHLQQANPSPEAEAAMAYVRVATALVGEKSASPSRVHLR
jgi:hypothetical protein